MSLPTAVLAGGLGTRLRPVTGDGLPKVLTPVLGRPFLDYKLAELARAGVERVVLLVGHGADQVAGAVDDGQWELEVTCIADGERLLGTGGALRRALPTLGPEFWVTYGDTLLTFDVADAEARFLAGDRDVLMTVLKNDDPGHANNALVSGELVVSYGKSPTPGGARHIDYGMLAVKARAIDDWSADAFDLAELLTERAQRRQVAAFEVTEPFREIGTPDALRATERFLAERGDFNPSDGEPPASH